jgi:hydroxymethylpyrimidine pyrophosphatase-like HAD family hydrolase
MYGITAEETICIGDNENDLSMIEYAGMGVAMGNATDVLKSVANYVTDTNDNDGVAKAIEKLALS